MNFLHSFDLNALQSAGIGSEQIGKTGWQAMLDDRPNTTDQLLNGTIAGLGRSSAIASAAAQPLVVTSTADTINANDNVLTLREAIQAANDRPGLDTITFDAIAFAGAQTITLTIGQLLINDSLILQGTGVDRFTISGDANQNGILDAGDKRLFFVNQGSVELRDLTLANGLAQGGAGGARAGGGAGMGGALFINGGTVSLNTVNVQNNRAVGGAGGRDTGSAGGGGGFGGSGGSGRYYDGSGGGGGGFGSGGNDSGYYSSGNYSAYSGGGGGGFSSVSTQIEGSQPKHGISGSGTVLGGNPAGNGEDGLMDGSSSTYSGGTGGGVGGGGGGGGARFYHSTIGGNGGSGGVGGGGGGGGASFAKVLGGIGGTGGDFGGGGGGGVGFAGGFGGNGGFGGGGGAGGVGEGPNRPGNINLGGNGGSGGFGGGGGGGGGSFAGNGGEGGSGGSFAGKGGNGGTSGNGGGGGGGAGLGGAVFVRSGSLTVTNTSFSDNTATGGVGGVTYNSAKAGTNGQGKGGAIFVHQGAIANFTSGISFTNNTATDAGSISADNAHLFGADYPVFTIANLAKLEGNSGDTAFEFTVQLSSPVGDRSITVNYTTADDTAIAGQDYHALSGRLTFAPNETQKTIRVLVKGDTLNEANETFAVKLLNSSFGAIAVNQATATILNDDRPKLTIKDVTRTEGNFGFPAFNSTAFNFVVSLDTPTTLPITVDYATSNGSEIAGGDYISTIGTLAFAPGETSKTIQVNVIGDLRRESNETFFVNLSNPVNVELINSQSTGTIINDDLVR